MSRQLIFRHFRQLFSFRNDPVTLQGWVRFSKVLVAEFAQNLVFKNLAVELAIALWVLAIPRCQICILHDDAFKLGIVLVCEIFLDESMVFLGDFNFFGLRVDTF